MAVLFAPILRTTQPAFAASQSSLTVYYTLPQAASLTDITNIEVKVNTQDTNTNVVNNATGILSVSAKTFLIANIILDISPPEAIFDNGFSFFYGASVADLQRAYHDEYKESLRCKYLSLDDQARLFVGKRHLPSLRKLLEFRFERHPKYNIAEETLQLMEAFVRERAQKTLVLYK